MNYYFWIESYEVHYRATSRIPSGPFERTDNPRHRYEFIQGIIDNFWRRWTRDFFPSPIILLLDGRVRKVHLEKIQKIENYPMESILSFDKDKDKTKDLFQDIYRSEKIIITKQFVAILKQLKHNFKMK